MLTHTIEYEEVVEPSYRIQYQVSIKLNVDSGGAIPTYTHEYTVYHGPDKYLAQDIAEGLKGANFRAPFSFGEAILKRM